MTTCTPVEKPRYEIKTPANLSPRIHWLREYYFQGVRRAWNNEYTSWTTGTPWDFQYNELTFYIVPETYAFLQTFRSAFNQTAHQVEVAPDFWSKWSHRRAPTFAWISNNPSCAATWTRATGQSHCWLMPPGCPFKRAASTWLPASPWRIICRMRISFR